MIALKHNGIVYIAGSQRYQNDVDAMRTGKVNSENIKVYHPQNRKNQLIATNMTTCVTEAVRYQKVFPKELNTKSLVLEVFPFLAQVSDFFNKSEKGTSAHSFVFAKDSEAFVIYRDGTCLEIENIYADTIASEVAMSLYDAGNIDDPMEFFRKAFATMEELFGEIMFPVSVLTTANNKIKVIGREK